MIKNLFLFAFAILVSAPAGAQSLYETLGLKPTATAEEIKSTWKKLVRENHPDRFMNDPVAAKAANGRLAVINAAETVLGNETLRAYYDFLSYRGQQHQRWERTSDNQDIPSLQKRFGGVDSVKLRTTTPPATATAQNTRPQPRPQPRPQAQATPRPTPTPEPKPQNTREPFINLFKQDIFRTENGQDLARFYLQLHPVERSAPDQIELLNLLKSPLREVNLESLAFIIAQTFEVQDSTVMKQIYDLLLSERANYRKIGLSILHYALENNRTETVLKITSASAQDLIIRFLDDADSSVRRRSQYALEKLNIKITKNYDALEIIKKLNSADAIDRNQSYQDLFQIKNFNDTELKSLVEILLNRRYSYELMPSTQLLMEMTTIIEVLESVPDLTVVAEDFKKFRNNILGKDLVLRSYALEQKIEKMSSQTRTCSKVFN